MTPVYVDAGLAAELPGGLPGMVWMDGSTRGPNGVYEQSGAVVAWQASPHTTGILSPVFGPGGTAFGRHGDVRIPLPGPDNLNAAGLLVRLAQSLQTRTQLESGCVPNLVEEGDEDGDFWVLVDQDGEPMWSFVPWPEEGAHVVPGVRTRDRMQALAAIVEWAGLLHGVARRAGVEVEPGTWPVWEWTSYGCWEIRSAGRTVAFAGDVTGDPADVVVEGIMRAGNDPAASLRATWDHLRDQIGGTP
jgi:hypothetical protein